MVRTSAKSTLISLGVDQVGDAGDTAHQDLIGETEGLGNRGFGVTDLEQPVIGDHDQRVDRILQIIDALFGVDRAPPPLRNRRAW